MTDYKKKYEEALERAKEMSALPDDRATIEYIFPELKESEDEKIKKAIHIYLDWLDGKKDYAPRGEYSIRNMLVWLEKQGEQNPTLPKWKYKKDNTPLLRDSLILNKYGCVAKSPSGALVSDVWVIDYDELAKLPKEEFEKQGEQKPYGQRKECKDCQMNYAGECKGSCQMKRDEQKPADKIEPICKPKKATCNDYKEIIEHYGVRKQLKKLSEEVYELQEAVIDLQDFTTCGNADTQRNQNVVEELADVFILLFQLQEFYGISKYEISDMICYKVERTLERIKKEVENDEQ